MNEIFMFHVFIIYKGYSLMIDLLGLKGKRISCFIFSVIAQKVIIYRNQC